MRTSNSATPQFSPDQLSPAELPFEDALRELDSVVAQLEAGRISLEESLQLMQRGVALADACDATLSRAEATLEQLVMTEDGELVAHRLQWEDDENEDATDE
ncbi:MAG TPA: exodeoxyribonuclease VII small subunit [Abditibacteriaceae bacterium]|jgi:exodeoxyribonuclease VII small subunit|nr:exodeoxyribonuclease VII small subunit [Abditibacteriaceae bacterium]